MQDYIKYFLRKSFREPDLLASVDSRFIAPQNQQIVNSLSKAYVLYLDGKTVAKLSYRSLRPRKYMELQNCEYMKSHSVTTVVSYSLSNL